MSEIRQQLAKYVSTDDERHQLSDEDLKARILENKGKYDIQISELQYNELEGDAYSFYHSINPDSFGRGGSTNNIIGDEIWVNGYMKNNSKNLISN